MPPSTPTITRDDILRVERNLETAKTRWRRAGRIRVGRNDIPNTEERVARLTSELQRVEQSRLPLDQLERFEGEVRTTRRRLRRVAVLVVGLRMRAWLWAYTAFLQRALGIGDGQMWLLSPLNGTWGALIVALIVILFGMSLSAFAILASVGYAFVALGSLRPLLRASNGKLKFIRADLDYRTASVRSQRDEARNNLTRSLALCVELRRGRDTRRQLKKARTRLSRLRENAVCQAEYDQVAGELTKLRRVLGSVRYDLLATDWRSLRDVPFEEFLARIFRSLGYQVQMTKTTGDQGVDLIITRNGQRLAIQAKGYEGSVGNSSVQEAHTGMVFYSCDECVVITNSHFTRGAKELAHKVRCLLIDGSQITELIHGHLL